MVTKTNLLLPDYLVQELKKNQADPTTYVDDFVNLCIIVPSVVWTSMFSLNN